MTARVSLRSVAQNDLADIFDYTRQTWSEAQAVTYLRLISDALDRLATFPEMAAIRDFIDPPVRVQKSGQHLIVYVVKNDSVDVIRILHSRSNWAAVLTGSVWEG